MTGLVCSHESNKKIIKEKGWRQREMQERKTDYTMICFYKAIIANSLYKLRAVSH